MKGVIPKAASRPKRMRGCRSISLQLRQRHRLLSQLTYGMSSSLRLQSEASPVPKFAPQVLGFRAPPRRLQRACHQGLPLRQASDRSRQHQLGSQEQGFSCPALRLICELGAGSFLQWGVLKSEHLRSTGELLNEGQQGGRSRCTF